MARTERTKKLKLCIKLNSRELDEVNHGLFGSANTALCRGCPKKPWLAFGCAELAVISALLKIMGHVPLGSGALSLVLSLDEQRKNKNTTK